MPHETRDKGIAPAQERESSRRKAVFPGFAPPVSNTTYTPNQFLDICLPNVSRGCLRVVAYLLRKTLGWCDAEGNPQHEQIEVSNAELERRAGVGHSLIRAALNEAMELHFIQCVKNGRAKSAGDQGETAVYSLKWDSSPRYARTLAEFRGFYEGEGYRTDIPNQFFDWLIPQETMAVIKVTGAVARHSIGFVAQRGSRRQTATLPYSQILKISGMASRRALAGAIRTAVSKNYIVCLDSGYFSARISERRSATYALHWSDRFEAAVSGGEITPKRTPAGLGITHSEKDTSRTADHSKKDISNAPKRTPADHSKKDTIEIKQLNEKQKQEAEAASLLKKEGFDGRTARALASGYDRESVLRQIEWLPERNATRNRIGLLRRAIEGNWPPPVPGAAKRNAGQPLPLPANYLKWLETEARSLAENSAGDHARFEAKRQRRRADLNAEKSAQLRAELLAGHDSEAGRLMDFQTFFALPGVRDWARDINNKSNQSQK